MSWLDKINNTKFKIQTGDGKEYFPLWKTGNKSREYNSTVFEFIDKEGSYVDRKKPKSAKYDMVIYFQGDDYLDQCDNFEKSANDPRYWTIEHPLYGTLIGQPLSLSRADGTLNNTEISIEFWESILTGVLKKSNSLKDEINSNTEILFEDSAISYASNIKPAPIDQTELQTKINHIDLQFKPLLNEDNKENFRSKFGKAKSAITKVIEDSYSAIKSVNEYINTPVDSRVSNVGKILGIPDEYRINTSIVEKVKTMYSIYESLKEDLFQKENKNNKSFFESAGAALIATVSQIVLNPDENDYTTRSEVEKIGSQLDKLYKDYIVTTDSLQTPIEDLKNNFSLSFAIHSNLNTIVNKTLYGLFSLAFNSKQERSVEIEKDTNLIVLTHKYFGLDEEDKNIEKFRKMNNIVNDRIFGVKKGTVIKYLE